jgi:hypothetical protein
MCLSSLDRALLLVGAGTIVGIAIGASVFVCIGSVVFVGIVVAVHRIRASRKNTSGYQKSSEQLESILAADDEDQASGEQADEEL